MQVADIGQFSIRHLCQKKIFDQSPVVFTSMIDALGSLRGTSKPIIDRVRSINFETRLSKTYKLM